MNKILQLRGLTWISGWLWIGVASWAGCAGSSNTQAPPRWDDRGVAAGTAPCEDGPTCLRFAERAEMLTRSTVEGSAWRRYMERACTLGSGEACERLALKLEEEGRGSPDSSWRILANTIRDRACVLGHPRSCYRIAEDMARGDSGRNKDITGALGIHHRLCIANYMPSCEQALERVRGESRWNAYAIGYASNLCRLQRWRCDLLAELLEERDGKNADPKKILCLLDRECGRRTALPLPPACEKLRARGLSPEVEAGHDIWVRCNNPENRETYPLPPPEPPR